MRRMIILSVLAFVLGASASAGVFFGLRFTQAVIVHGGLW